MAKKRRKMTMSVCGMSNLAYGLDGGQYEPGGACRHMARTDHADRDYGMAVVD
jgi:hypothetical protein